jgi:RNA polymerase sigma factor (sigma-70 family)
VANNKSEILKCIKSGEHNKALSYLYETTLKKVRQYIMKNKGSKDDANDIFQDSVIIFFNQVRNNKFDEKYDIDAFIFSVSRNLWIDKIRRDSKMVNYEFPDQFKNESDNKNHLDDLITKEKSSAMHTVFNKLDEKCKKILSYVIYDKLSMKQICEKMGYSSEDVAKTNHYRCKQALTKIVKNDIDLVNLLRN